MDGRASPTGEAFLGRPLREDLLLHPAAVSVMEAGVACSIAFSIRWTLLFSNFSLSSTFTSCVPASSSASPPSPPSAFNTRTATDVLRRRLAALLLKVINFLRLRRRGGWEEAAKSADEGEVDDDVDDDGGTDSGDVEGLSEGWGSTAWKAMSTVTGLLLSMVPPLLMLLLLLLLLSLSPLMLPQVPASPPAGRLERNPLLLFVRPSAAVRLLLVLGAVVTLVEARGAASAFFSSSIGIGIVVVVVAVVVVGVVTEAVVRRSRWAMSSTISVWSADRYTCGGGTGGTSVACMCW